MPKLTLEDTYNIPYSMFEYMVYSKPNSPTKNISSLNYNNKTSKKKYFIS